VVQQVHKVLRELETQVIKAQVGLVDHKAHRVTKEIKVTKGHKELKEIRVMLDHKAHKVTKEMLDHKAHKAHKASVHQ
jgi:hypothetical protein